MRLIWTVTLGLLAGVCLILLLFRRPLLRLVSRFGRRWASSDGMSGGLHSFLIPKRVAPSFVLHVICWALGGLEAWVTLHLMGIRMTMPEALAIDSLVTSLRTFGFWVPAALGVQEAAYVLVCVLFGLSPHVAIAFSLVRRARDLLIGCIGLAVWQGTEVLRTASIPNLRRHPNGGNSTSMPTFRAENCPSDVSNLPL